MSVNGYVVAEIGAGAVVLLGVASGDGKDDAQRLAGKVARLRIFENDDGRFDRSLLDIDGEALVVSQFTLLGGHAQGQPAELHGRGCSRASPSRCTTSFCAELANAGVPRLARSLRCADAGLARQRRAGDDRPRRVMVDATV